MLWNEIKHPKYPKGWQPERVASLYFLILATYKKLTVKH
jgi:hypothetical protein